MNQFFNVVSTVGETIVEHAGEFLPYFMTVIGFLIVYVLNGIKGEIKEVKITVRSLEADLRGRISDLDRRHSGLDRRVALLEGRCDANHE